MTSRERSVRRDPEGEPGRVLLALPQSVADDRESRGPRLPAEALAGGTPSRGSCSGSCVMRCADPVQYAGKFRTCHSSSERNTSRPRSVSRGGSRAVHTSYTWGGVAGVLLPAFLGLCVLAEELSM